MDTGMENDNNTIVTDDAIIRDRTDYSGHALAEVVDGKHENDLILVTRYRIVK